MQPTKIKLIEERMDDIDYLLKMYPPDVILLIRNRTKAWWDLPETYFERRTAWSMPLAWADDLNDDPMQLIHEMMFMPVSKGGDMNFLVYTYDPGETPTKFRTIQICEHESLRDALQELYRQIERLEENGIIRVPVAWELFDDERPPTATFDDTEKRVRQIVDQYGKEGSGSRHGVLDLAMARKLAGGTVAQQSKVRPKVPVEAHMPDEQKASAEDCMIAIRILCGVTTHDPLKKFEKKD